MGWGFAKILVLALGLSSSCAFALESSMIAPVSGQPPRCTSQQYIGVGMPPMATLPIGPCMSCQSTVQQQMSSANGALSSGQAADAATSASSGAGTASQAAGTTGFQDNTQGSNAAVNDIGKTGLQQHAASAQKTSAAMKQCSQQIKSSCSGGLAGEDKSAADQVAQECDRAGQQADQVASEKTAKAGEMGSNEGKSAGNENKMGQMPQMPQMGQGGGGGAGSGSNSGLSGSDLASNLSTSTATEKNLETAKVANTKGASLPMFSGTEGVKVDMPGAKEPDGTETGISQAQSQAPGSSGAGVHSRMVAAENGAGGGSAGAMGVSLGSAGGAGALGSGGSSSSGEAAGGGGGASGSPGTLLGSASGDAMVPYTGSGASTYTPLKSAVLGLATDGQELKDFVGTSSLEGGTPAPGHKAGPLHDRQGGLTKAINEQSLFQRVSFRIRRISADRTMQ